MPTTEPPPDVFSVSRRFDMATILVAMVGYAILFALLLQIPGFPSWAIGTMGASFAVIAAGQAVAIRWGNPRAASIIAGALFWAGVAVIVGLIDGARNPCELIALVMMSGFFGPIYGYLAGTLVGGVFLISHYLRESKGLRRARQNDEPDDPWSEHAPPPLQEDR